MKVSQIQAFPVGYKFGGGFPLTVKTLKKKWETPEGWVQQCVLTDDTGDILADVFLDKKSLFRSWTIDIIVAEIQATDTGTKMYVSQWSVPTMTADDLPIMDFGVGDQTKTIRSKILCWLTAAKIQSGATNKETRSFVEDPITHRIVDKIMEG